MTDAAAFDDEARRLAQELRASAERAQLRTATPDFEARVERGERHFAIEVLVAGVIAAVVVTLILSLPRPRPAAPTPAGPTVPVFSPPATPSPTLSPTPSPAIQSTITSTGPLALYWTSSAQDGSVTLTARAYSGAPAGVLVLPPSSSGFAIAPNGMRVLNGDQIIAVSGTVLGTLPAQYFLTPLPPIWAEQLCASLRGQYHRLARRPGHSSSLMRPATRARSRRLRKLRRRPRAGRSCRAARVRTGQSLRTRAVRAQPSSSCSSHPAVSSLGTALLAACRQRPSRLTTEGLSCSMSRRE